MRYLTSLWNPTIKQTTTFTCLLTGSYPVCAFLPAQMGWAEYQMCSPFSLSKKSYIFISLRWYWEAKYLEKTLCPKSPIVSQSPKCQLNEHVRTLKIIKSHDRPTPDSSSLPVSSPFHKSLSYFILKIKTLIEFSLPTI